MILSGEGKLFSSPENIKEVFAVKNAVKNAQPVPVRRKLISPLQRGVGLVLIILGLLIMLVGLFGYLAGDWQIGPFAQLTDQVFIAREVATSA